MSDGPTHKLCIDIYVSQGPIYLKKYIFKLFEKQRKTNGRVSLCFDDMALNGRHSSVKI